MRRAIYLSDPQLQSYQPHAFQTIGGGDCFFHSVANAFYTGYRSGMVDDEQVSKQDIVKMLRQELADKLSNIDHSTGESYYLGIAKGNVASLGEDVYEYSLDGLYKHLASNQPVGDVVICYTSKVLKKDIYVIDEQRKDLYMLPDVPEGKQPSIVINYKCGHYEMIGLRDGSDFSTYFTPDHPFIVGCRNRLYSLKKD